MTQECPRPALLWDLLDGTLAQGTEIELRLHLEACAACQQFLKSARRCESSLRLGEMRVAEPEFESEFRTRLMQRLATSGEERRARGLGEAARRWSPRAAGILILLAFGLTGAYLAGVATENDTAPAVSMAELDREWAREEARLEFLDSLHDFKAQRPGAAAFLKSFEERFEGLGLRLDREVIRVLEVAELPLLRPALALAAKHRSPSYTPVLKELLAREEAGDDDLVEELLLALAELHSPDSMAALAAVARSRDEDPARRRLATEILAEKASPRANALLRPVLRARGAHTGAGVIAILAQRRDAVATHLLRELFLAGHQSDILFEHLVSQPETARWIRRRLLGGGNSREQVRLLCRLAGRVQDAATLPALLHWMEREESAVLAALVALDTRASLDIVASRLLNSSERGLSADRDQSHELAARALRKAARGRAAYFLERSREAQGTRGRRFVLASGFCGDDAVVAALAQMVERDDREVEALEALAAIGGDAVEALLKAFSSSSDPGVRRTAARLLDERSP